MTQVNEKKQAILSGEETPDWLAGHPLVAVIRPYAVYSYITPFIVGAKNKEGEHGDLSTRDPVIRGLTNLEKVALEEEWEPETCDKAANYISNIFKDEELRGKPGHDVIAASLRDKNGFLRKSKAEWTRVSKIKRDKKKQALLSGEVTPTWLVGHLFIATIRPLAKLPGMEPFIVGAKDKDGTHGDLSTNEVVDRGLAAVKREATDRKWGAGQSGNAASPLTRLFGKDSPLHGTPGAEVIQKSLSDEKGVLNIWRKGKVAAYPKPASRRRDSSQPSLSPTTPKVTSARDGTARQAKRIGRRATKPKQVVPLRPLAPKQRIAIRPPAITGSLPGGPPRADILVTRAASPPFPRAETLEEVLQTADHMDNAHSSAALAITQPPIRTSSASPLAVQPDDLAPYQQMLTEEAQHVIAGGEYDHIAIDKFRRMIQDPRGQKAFNASRNSSESNSLAVKELERIVCRIIRGVRDADEQWAQELVAALPKIERADALSEAELEKAFAKTPLGDGELLQVARELGIVEQEKWNSASIVFKPSGETVAVCFKDSNGTVRRGDIEATAISASAKVASDLEVGGTAFADIACYDAAGKRLRPPVANSA